MKSEKDKDNTKKLIVIFSISIIILIGLVVVGTYAFFTAGVKDERTNSEDSNTNIQTAILTEFGLENGTLTGDNLIPGDTVTKTFSITNVSKGAMTYKLVWKDITNEFVNKKDLIVTLEGNGTALISESNNITFPNSSEGPVTLKDNLTINAGETQNFTLKITYRNDPNNNQIDDMGKVISATIAVG